MLKTNKDRLCLVLTYAFMPLLSLFGVDGEHFLPFAF